MTRKKKAFFVKKRKKKAISSRRRKASRASASFRKKRRRPQKKILPCTSKVIGSEALTLLKKTDIHPTAEWIYKRLKKHFPSLSLDTLCKNLRLLKEKGLIWELDFGKGLSRYSVDLAPLHYHFFCEACKRVYDIKIPSLKELDQKVRDITGFQVRTHKVDFFGLCEVCRRRLPLTRAPEEGSSTPPLTS